MAYGILTLVYNFQLTPAQLAICIRIGARSRYNERVGRQKYLDWETAVSRWRDANGTRDFPTDEQIRPIAQQVYYERLKREYDQDFNEAVRQWTSEGVPYPDAEMINNRIAYNREQRRKQYELHDWYETERDAMISGRILAPTEFVPAA